MFLASFVSALCLYRAVIALGPVATSAISPQPAHQGRRYSVLAAHPLVTDGPRIDEHILLERQAVATCGYVSGNGGMQIHCHLLWSTRSGFAANTQLLSQHPLSLARQDTHAPLPFRTWSNGHAVIRSNVKATTEHA